MREIFVGLADRFPEVRFAHLPVYQHVDHPPEGTRLTHLADRAQLTKQALIEVIDDMERKGLVERVADPTDRRAKLIRLTVRGMAVHDAANDVGLAIQSRWSDQLGDEAFSKLTELLARLGDVVGADPRHG